MNVVTCQWKRLWKSVNFMNFVTKTSVAYFPDQPINAVHKTTTKLWVCYYFSSAIETRPTIHLATPEVVTKCVNKTKFLLLHSATTERSGDITATSTESERVAWEPSYLSDPFGCREPTSKQMRELVMGRDTIFGRCLHWFQRATAARLPVYLFTSLFISRMPTEAEQKEDETSRAVRMRPREARCHPEQPRLTVGSLRRHLSGNRVKNALHARLPWREVVLVEHTR